MPDLVLHASDSDNGTLDPAFDAHLLPLQSLAFAWWQGWQPQTSLLQAVDCAKDKGIVEGKACWAKVTGPITNAVASAIRIGWTFLTGSTLLWMMGSS